MAAPAANLLYDVDVDEFGRDLSNAMARFSPQAFEVRSIVEKISCEHSSARPRRVFNVNMNVMMDGVKIAVPKTELAIRDLIEIFRPIREVMTVHYEELDYGLIWTTIQGEEIAIFSVSFSCKKTSPVVVTFKNNKTAEVNASDSDKFYKLLRLVAHHGEGSSECHDRMLLEINTQNNQSQNQ
jgi:hypothetical protein